MQNTFQFSLLSLFLCQFLGTRNLRGNGEVGRKTVSAWELQTGVCYEVLASVTPCVAGFYVSLCSPKPCKPWLIKSAADGTKSHKGHTTLLHQAILCISFASSPVLDLFLCALCKFFLLVTLCLYALSSLPFLFLFHSDLKWWMVGIRTRLCQDYANTRRWNGHLYHSQVIQHVSHVPSVVQSISVSLLCLRHLALVLQYVPQISPG